ncbi:MAG: nitrous oxide reductase family maturation protein NosD [Gemmatimonadaceae bacterium]
MKRFYKLALASWLIALPACNNAPRALVAGRDACDYCRMGVSDVRFGGELQVQSGRIYTFDSIECLASFYLDAADRDDVRGVWVADYSTSKLVTVDSALFVQAEDVHSPMGRSLIALASSVGPAQMARYGTTTMRWPEVVAFVRSQQVIPVVAVPATRDSSLTFDRQSIIVDQTGALRTIGAALAIARPGAHIHVRPGTYIEPTLRITVPVTLDGEGAAVLDGEGRRGLIEVAADDVTVRGFVLRNTGTSHVEDRAALRVDGQRNCRIENNRVDNTFFAIYLARVSDCVVHGNIVRGSEQSQTTSGNGIHLWQSERVQVSDNRVSGHRDGIYFEFVKSSQVLHNVSERSDRYGLHFMFSDDCRYQNNLFRENGAGVAVMYTKRVHMLANRFEHNWGSNAYGLLLKDINDSEILNNEFVGNSIGLHLEGSSHNRVTENEFTRNGWALRVLADAQDNVISRNTFVANSFDVATNSRQNFSTFRENYWDRYRGYDLDRDGIGDAPHAPVRLFALVVEQSPPALVLLHSVVVDMLDLAERVLPVLTPATLIDDRPLMQSPATARGSTP